MHLHLFRPPCQTVGPTSIRQCCRPYLFNKGPLVPPLTEAATGQHVDGLGSTQLMEAHLLVQKVLKGELLVFIVDVIHHLYL